ncbi:MAG: hypothetical protein R2849_14545 [Thermomicrobiales bacterium]
MPEWSKVSIIEPSPHDEATAYLAVIRYMHGDPAPYLYKTSDYGQSWTKITNGIPEDQFTRVIREDPEPQGPALCRDRGRPACLVRRRTELAAVPVQLAGLPDPRRHHRRH